ncbi:MAG: response regulator [Pseudodesulfovibrio sp.]|nr:response regulator [Pseudodesulfovibrio sp.]
MKILLVDDEVELVSAMAERLSLRGIDADWTDSGEKALGMARQCEYDIAVLDMKMPKLNGLELRRQLSVICPPMKFIFLSGHGSVSDFEAGSAEAESYLIKPIRIEDLISKIEEATR